jgi:hypothetical protein
MRRQFALAAIAQGGEEGEEGLESRSLGWSFGGADPTLNERRKKNSSDIRMIAHPRSMTTHHVQHRSMYLRAFSAAGSSCDGMLSKVS